MKKRSEAYLAKKDAKRAAAGAARAQPPIRSGALRSDRPTWIRVTEYLVGTLVVGTVGLVASVYQIQGGPPWPVGPVFVPGFPSAGNAFDVPFTVTNKSAFFSLRHLEILCGFEKKNRCEIEP